MIVKADYQTLRKLYRRSAVSHEATSKLRFETVCTKCADRNDNSLEMNLSEHHTGELNGEFFIYYIFYIWDMRE